jgi:hypothetical protein
MKILKHGQNRDESDHTVALTFSEYTSNHMEHCSHDVHEELVFLREALDIVA